MIVHHNLAEISPLKPPIFLTIGNFDGVHRGHQFLLQTIFEQAKKARATFAVLSFQNHPSTVLQKHQPIQRICTNAHKENLLAEQGVDVLLHIPFTEKLARQSAREFLFSIRSILHFTHLVLGFDSRIGKNREGNPVVLQAIAQEMGFSIKYLEDEQYEGEIISSTVIRNKILEGKWNELTPWLGRPYSIYGPLLHGNAQAEGMEFPTVRLPVEALVLPPFGVYTVTVSFDEKILPGIANLGITGTVRQSEQPLLEIHILDDETPLHAQFVEVVFHTFLGPEKKFSNLEELKNKSI